LCLFGSLSGRLLDSEHRALRYPTSDIMSSSARKCARRRCASFDSISLTLTRTLSFLPELYSLLIDTAINDECTIHRLLGAALINASRRRRRQRRRDHGRQNALSFHSDLQCCPLTVSFLLSYYLQRKSKRWNGSSISFALCLCGQA
jgi:hypothetical protein